MSNIPCNCTFVSTIEWEIAHLFLCTTAATAAVARIKPTLILLRDTLAIRIGGACIFECMAECYAIERNEIEINSQCFCDAIRKSAIHLQLIITCNCNRFDFLCFLCRQLSPLNSPFTRWKQEKQRNDGKSAVRVVASHAGMWMRSIKTVSMLTTASLYDMPSWLSD